MNLSDEELLEVYYSALQLDLDKAFIEIIEEEMASRKLNPLFKKMIVTI
ncbi:MAG TPA: sporulation histidine kinase inhibitor Sda [Sporolactobacillaceae bacterium]|nr:sporulation histidine kinase inhibitor Sda [Sporolactobacillaceae bacterium]